MKVLILDHHFGRDIESLKRSMPPLTQEDASVRTRLSMLQAGTAMISENWLTGVGLGEFEQRVDEYREPTPCVVKPRRSAHSTYLRLFAEAGVLAGVANFAVIGVIAVSLLRAALRATSDWRSMMVGFTCGWVGLAIMAASYDRFATLFVWVYLALACSVAVVSRAHRSGSIERIADEDTSHVHAI